MCRHLAYLGPERSLASLLHDPPRSLELQSWKPRLQREGAINADGWGVGWWDLSVRPEPARYRTAAPMWTDGSFRSVAQVVRAEAIVAAVRSATPPAPIVATGNAPFTVERWLFSLNGFVTGFRTTGVGERLRRSVTEARAQGIEGSTDTEVLFALVLDQLDQGLPAPDAVATVLRHVLDVTEGRLNLLLSDGDQIVATACGNSLVTLHGTGLAAGGVLVASEPLDDDPAWTTVPDGSVVLARRDDLRVVPLATFGGPS
jgi:glutamine amidotransferase